VDGTAVERVSDLQGAIEQRAPGDQVTLTLWRQGEVVQVPVTLNRWRD
jgi:S1-C subfamily serine protease